ncbi:LuxR family transcriptional regulator [Nocardia sp. NBC_01503]|uniref:helix-turn-helix transcriptional regulator n=1 Tax=Nocardia sp. NBC_01503 TaxID=2975997 RepID=UPI002E7B4125|nr:LuxR family transcriptional regulator [Nocardia sp. NBC_01503]WTL35458.1 LuxR family transcriptional regulator [Nocardia sp. NBC_01503]
MREEQRIGAVLSEAGRGRSGVLAVVAGPGEGKSALLARAVELVGPQWRILRYTGVETEAELAFSGLGQLLEPALPLRDLLPEPQCLALGGALGLAHAAHPERFLVGLATLSLLAELSVQGPVLVLVDDAQWVDQPSIDALLFTARRLENEGVAMLFAGRPDFAAPGLPQLVPAPLDTEAALALLADRMPQLPMEIRDRVVQESAGNPLALLDLPGMNLDSLPVGPLALSDRLLSGYQGHIEHLSAAARLALLVAAAEADEDLGVVLKVLDALGIGAEPLAEAEHSTMITVIGQSVAFRHPLLRAAAYRSATDAQRIAVHTALARALISDPDRYAWHLAAATVGADEKAAAALEAAAERACVRTGHGAAATAWERSAQLTPDPVDRARRLVAAVETAADAGQFARARRLAEQARELTCDAVHRARLATVLAHIEFEHGSPATAQRLLQQGAAETALADPKRAGEMLLDAGRVAWTIGDMPGMRTSRAMLAELPSSPDRDRFLGAYEGTLGLIEPDPSAGITLLRSNLSVPEQIRHHEPAVRFVLATQAIVIGDIAVAREILADLSEFCRMQGRLGWLAPVELWLSSVEFLAGRFRDSELLSTEGRRIAENTDQPIRIFHADSNLAVLAAVRGDERRCRELADVAFAQPDLTSTHRAQFDWALTLSDMGAGRYATALDRMDELLDISTARNAQWLTVHADRVECAVRLNQPERVADSLERLRLWSAALEAPWAEALWSRCLGLVHGDPEFLIRAMDLHARQTRWFDRARTGLLYGEWLRRERRTGDARAELREALDIFERLGAHPWSQRAREELRASGAGAIPEGSRGPAADLTPQELQVARLAATGATNKEIGASLFLSPKTVGHHLSRIFRKLGVSSRVELARLELD